MAATLRQSTRADVLARAGMAGGQLLYVAALYLLVVVLGARLLRDSGLTEVALTVLAAALVTLTLPVLREGLHHWLPTSPDTRLLALLNSPTDADVGERLSELTLRVSQALGQGIQTEIRGSLGAGLSTTWEWPELDPSRIPSCVVAHLDLARGDRVLGRIAVRSPTPRTLTPVEQRLLRDAADYAALLLDTARMDRTLQQFVDDSAERQRRLQESRGRILTAVEEERRRLERDIHDGAQQHLVALVVNLRLLAVLLSRDPARARATAHSLQTAVSRAVETLERLSMGLYPSLLVTRGLVVALQAVADVSPVPVVVQADRHRRWSPLVEQAAYFSCLEALQNAVKHAEATRIVITVSEGGGGITFEVSDDGCGFNPTRADPGSGSANLQDRVSAAGGDVRVLSAPGRGTTVSGWIPEVPPDPGRGA